MGAAVVAEAAARTAVDGARNGAIRSAVGALPVARGLIVAVRCYSGCRP